MELFNINWFRTPKLTIARLGDQNLNPSVTDGARPIDYGILKSIKHPKYNGVTKENDIALFKLNNVVEFTKFARPACLQVEENEPTTELVAVSHIYSYQQTVNHCSTFVRLAGEEQRLKARFQTTY